LSRWDKFERAKVVKKHTRARDLFSRHIRAKKNAHESLERFLPLLRVRKVLSRSRGLARIVFFETKKNRFFKNPSFLETKPNQTHASAEKGSTRATRESTQRERKRKKEGTTRTGGFTGSLFRTSHVDFLRQFFFLMTIRSPFSDK